MELKELAGRLDRPLLLARYDEAKAELSPTGPDILRGEPG